MKSVRLAPVVAWRLIVRSRSHSRGLRDSPKFGATSPPLAYGQLSRPSLPVRSGIASSCVLFERPRIRGALGLCDRCPLPGPCRLSSDGFPLGPGPWPRPADAGIGSPFLALFGRGPEMVPEEREPRRRPDLDRSLPRDQLDEAFCCKRPHRGVGRPPCQSPRGSRRDQTIIQDGPS